MPKHIDITGKRFGQVVAIRPIPERYHDGSVQWLCRCDCGQAFTCPLTILRQRAHMNCGCIGKYARRRKPNTRTTAPTPDVVQARIQSFLCTYPATELEMKENN